jgi:hypothetical protein
MRVSRLALAGLGACAQSNPSAGTYDDINCPTSCFLLGNALDMSVLGQECWPCHNVCPPGTCWDTTGMLCSATPSATNPTIPTTVNDAPVPAPVDCTSTWNTMFNPQCGGSTTALMMIGGIAIVALLGVVLVNKL